jgi:hypothetical protein
VRVEPILTATGILASAVVLAAAIAVAGRIRVERERTLQRLVDRGLSADELIRILGTEARGRLDRRRGALLLAVGGAWTAVTYAIGGRAWTLGAVPVALGLALLVVGSVDGRRR